MQHLHQKPDQEAKAQEEALSRAAIGLPPDMSEEDFNAVCNLATTGTARARAYWLCWNWRKQLPELSAKYPPTEDDKEFSKHMGEQPYD